MKLRLSDGNASSDERNLEVSYLYISCILNHDSGPQGFLCQEREKWTGLSAGRALEVIVNFMTEDILGVLKINKSNDPEAENPTRYFHRQFSELLQIGGAFKAARHTRCLLSTRVHHLPSLLSAFLRTPSPSLRRPFLRLFLTTRRHTLVARSMDRGPYRRLRLSV